LVSSLVVVVLVLVVEVVAVVVVVVSGNTEYDDKRTLTLPTPCGGFGDNARMILLCLVGSRCVEEEQREGRVDTIVKADVSFSFT
jgi:hypothetical protein